MRTILCIVIGVLYAGGMYMMLRRSLLKLIVGIVLLSNGANLLIFAVGGRLSRANPPIIPADSGVIGAGIVNPLPQALVLTAIVIGFGVLAFALVLFHSAYRAVGTDDLDAMTGTDR
jgi:multicomponent Na+:H+ antiporter subunit C